MISRFDYKKATLRYKFITNVWAFLSAFFSFTICSKPSLGDPYANILYKYIYWKYLTKLVNT